MSSDPIVSSVSDPLYPSIFIGRTEAEDLLIDRDFKVAYNPHASGGAMLQADGYYSIAGGYFDGPAGVYDITLGYFDARTSIRRSARALRSVSKRISARGGLPAHQERHRSAPR